MIGGFDFGKSLLKQVEGFRRLSAEQRKKREPALSRELEKYARKYLEVVSKPGAANPGLLKNGAEALVEAAVAVQESNITYVVFGELVARSRKVPVVPGLAALVDRLLVELPTQMKDERVAMLAWRISTGSLRPERYLQYSFERAALTGDLGDWKDLSWGVAQLIQKGTLAPADDITLQALRELSKNKLKLGERGVQMELLLAETLMARRESVEAEMLLVEVAQDARVLPETFVEVAEKLIGTRPEATWVLHQLALVPSIAAYSEGRMPWNILQEKFLRSRARGDELLHFLIEHDLQTHDEKMAVFTVERILRCEPLERHNLLEAWTAAYRKAGVARPQRALELIANGPVELTDSETKEQAAVAEEPLPAKAAVEDTVEQAQELADEESAEAAGVEEEAAVAQESEQAEEEPEAEPESVDDAPDETDPEAEQQALDEPDSAAEELPEDRVLQADLVEAEPEAEVLVAPAAAAAADIEEEVDTAEVDAEAAADEEAVAEAAADADLEDLAESDLVAETAEFVGEPALSAAEPEAAMAEPEAERPPRETAALAALAWQAAHCADLDALQTILDEAATSGQLDPAASLALADELAAAQAPEWVQAWGRVWLGERLLRVGEEENAVALLGSLTIPDSDAAAELTNRIRVALGGRPAGARVRMLLSRLDIAAGAYRSAYDIAQGLGKEDPARSELLADLDVRITALREPEPELLMLLAKVRRTERTSPEAGFEPATTAALLLPDDAEIQEGYKSWLAELPPTTVHYYRAQQATFLCVGGGRETMLDTALAEIEALSGQTPPPSASDPLRWLSQLRPLLESAAASQRNALRLRWTRLYLLCLSRASQLEELQAALDEAAAEIEPEEVLEICVQLGPALPVEARLAVECKSHLQRGDWESVLSLASSDETPYPSVIVPIRQLCENIPAQELLPAAERLAQIMMHRGDSAGELKLIESLDARLAGGNGDSEPAANVRSLTEGMLKTLCEQRYEPAVRYRLAASRQHGELSSAARDLLALHEAGDETALVELGEVFYALLAAGETAGLLTEIASTLARERAQTEPELALEGLARAGLAAAQAPWALLQISELGLAPVTPGTQLLCGQLALAAGKTEEALAAVEQLAVAGDGEDALALGRQVLQSAPESEHALTALIRLLLTAEALDVPLITRHLLQLARLFQDRDTALKDAFGALSAEAGNVLADHAAEQDVLHISLLLSALSGEQDAALQFVREAVSRGPQSVQTLLGLFEGLAMEDADMPTALVLAWGSALYAAGRTGDALDRLSGLRQAVSDYPEYLALLHEIKDSGGGSGASMQLGEAYLHVNLWQQSAEEYSAALEAEPYLAVPVLTQLRASGALEPNPMKYPLHLLGLRAVAGSDRPADWGWALSALSWLLPRWSPEELFGLAENLWTNIQRCELDSEQRVELALVLYRLAGKLRRPAEALQYLGAAWEAAEEKRPDLITALHEFDKHSLPSDSPLHAKLQHWILQSAVLENNTRSMLAAAKELAAISTEGRDIALSELAAYQEKAADPVPVLQARLDLLDMESAAEREVFVRELLNAADAELTTSQAHGLIRTMLARIEAHIERPELTRALLLLFRKLGDESRAWQLALAHVDGEHDPAPTALEILSMLAAEEFNTAQKLTLIEARLLRGEPDEALAVLRGLDLENLGDFGPQAAELAESLCGTAEAAPARRWLIGYYRKSGQLVQAAAHTVWAQAAHDEIPADWLHEQRGGDLLFYSGQLMELAGNLEAARRQYERGRLAECQDTSIRAALRTRLSQIYTAEGALEQALRLAQEAAEVIPEHGPAQQLVQQAQRAIRLQQIGTLRTEPDSVERTLAISALLRSCGELTDAIGELQAGLSRGQTKPEMFVELAECFVDTQDFNIARRAFSEVLRRIESSGADVELKLRGLYGLATAEERLDNLPEAVRCLEQILMLRHDYRDSRERLQRLYNAQKPGAAKQGGAAKAEILDEIMALLGVPKPPDEKGKP